MKNCLIGYTGFIGKNILRQKKFTNFYNTKNINQISAHKFNLALICAPHAKKWWANKYPKKDSIIVDNLIQNLRSLKTKKVIFISTIDIYETKENLNEKSKIKISRFNVYGKNRLKIEKFIINNFKDYHIIRLPALFGKHLKKNILYDLIYNNNLDQIILNSSYQWYDIEDLYSDIKIILNKRIKLINLFPEPITTNELVDKFFPQKKNFLNKKKLGPSYNLKSLYYEIFSKKNGYIREKKQILNKLKVFIKNEIINI